MNTYYEERENEYFAYMEAMEILKEEAETEEDDYRESVNFWEMVEKENWKRFEGCFD